jgi:hypothetical protein
MHTSPPYPLSKQHYQEKPQVLLFGEGEVI